MEFLVCLEFFDVEKVWFKVDLNSILGMVEKFNDFDVEGVELLVYFNDVINCMCED